MGGGGPAVWHFHLGTPFQDSSSAFVTAPCLQYTCRARPAAPVWTRIGTSSKSSCKNLYIGLASFLAPSIYLGDIIPSEALPLVLSWGHILPNHSWGLQQETQLPGLLDSLFIRSDLSVLISALRFQRAAADLVAQPMEHFSRCGSARHNLRIWPPWLAAHTTLALRHLL